MADTRTNEYIQEQLDLVYLNQDFAGIGDTGGLRGSVAAGNLYVALLQSGSEANYTSYARQPIVRSASGFSRTNNVITNIAQLTFPKSTGVENTITKVAVYTALTGGIKLHEQTLQYPFVISPNVSQPIIEIGQITITGGN